MSSTAWVICEVSYWELKVGLALHFGNTSPNREGDRFPRCMLDTHKASLIYLLIRDAKKRYKELAIL